MSADLMYLKEDAYFEPLINHWFAWSYLVPPVQAARHIATRHKRTMMSFVKNTQLHVLAAKESVLSGGDFLDVREDQVEEIRALIAEIDTRRADLVALSDAVKDLDDLIRKHTNGESIEYLYGQVPQPLKGFVEITMDMNHNPSYRLLEVLLYRSEHYKPDLQSASFGLVSRVKQRPFCFSTPRLPDENHVQLKLDFNSPQLTTILRSRVEGAPGDLIQEIFSKTERVGGLDYRELFSASAPPRQHTPVEKGVRIRFLGHAAFLLETPHVAIALDPVIAVRGEAYENEVFSYSELPPKLDYICITHNHQDHYNLETLLQLRHKTGKLILPVNNGGTLPDPSMKLIARQLGFEVIEVDDFDQIEVPGGTLTAIPFLGEHGDLNVRSKTVWFVELQGRKFFFGADATNYDPCMYQHVQKIVGDVDVLAIGMECVGAPYTWLYGALNTKAVSKNIMSSRRLNGANAEQANHMVDTFNARQVYLYAMGMEPWYRYFMGTDYSGGNPEQIVQSDQVIAYCTGKGIPCERLVGKKTLYF
jgi:L-ascorbate metabolism protein UlaG (beta-lactamase superfamily)